jgi:hypothetical protein
VDERLDADKNLLRLVGFDEFVAGVVDGEGAVGFGG